MFDKLKFGQSNPFKGALIGLQQRLRDSGIDLDDRFTNLPDRLAELRGEVEQEQAAKKTTTDESSSDKGHNAGDK